MMIRNIPLRHELKYLITPAELTVLRNTLAPLMQLDQGHEYLIRSLYFDTNQRRRAGRKDCGRRQPQKVPHPHLQFQRPRD